MSVEANSRLVDPATIGDSELVASNVAGALPLASSATTYDTWDAADTYATSDVVCWIYSSGAASPQNTFTADRFGVFTSKINGNINYEPAKMLFYSYWSEDARAAVYVPATTYALNDLVFYTASGFSAIYRSLAGSNTGNTPSSSPSWWVIEEGPAGVWDTAATYNQDAAASRESGGVGYLYTSSVSKNAGNDPLAARTLPGASVWTKISDVAVWSASATYGANAIVGRVDGATGAIYQSLKPANFNQDPNTEAAWWKQIAANAYETWSGATTYALDALVCVFVLNRLGYIYRSLQASNLNHAPGTSPTWWELAGEAYQTWDVAITYAVGEIVSDTRTRHDYESVIGSNTGNDPTADDGTKWLDLGASMRWRMFDDSNNSQTTHGNALDATIRMGTALDTIALLEVDADEVQIIVTDDGDTLYDETFPMFERPGETGWYTYFFAQQINRRTVLASDLFVPSGADIRIIASRPSATAAIGNVLVGRAIALGASLMDAEVGIEDFSRVEEDAFGTRSIVERNYRKIANLVIAVDADRSDSVGEALAARRARATLYIGADEFSSLIIYGFAKSYRGQIKYTNLHYFPIELIGIT